MPPLLIGVLLPWLVVGVGCWAGFQLLRQNGRILLRLEQLEREFASLAALVQAAREGRSLADSASQAEPARPALPAGLTPGVPAPAFELPDLSGARTSLAQFRGRRVLLV